MPLEYPKAVSVPPLAPTVAALGDDVREALSRVAGLGFRHVQMSALQPGTRPRDLDQSGRRDLAATLKRLELAAAGLDCWVPTEHFLDPQRVDRAVSAVCSAIELAADLGRVTVSAMFPADPGSAVGTDPGHSAGVSALQSIDSVIAAVGSFGAKLGVRIADHIMPPMARGATGVIGVGIDVAAALSANLNPARLVHQHSGSLFSVRVCDLHRNGMRGPIGEASSGRLDVLELRVAATMATGVQPLVLDARQWSDPWQGIERSRQAWDAG